MKCTLILMLVFLLSGCCSLCPDKVKEVYIKTGCAPPAVVATPVLKVDALTAKSTYKETVEAYVFDVMALRLYTEQLNKSLEPYKSCQSPSK